MRTAPAAIRPYGDANNDTTTASPAAVATAGSTEERVAGDAALAGQSGDDDLTGGANADMFRFTRPMNRVDVITDYALAKGDRIDLVAGRTSVTRAEQFNGVWTLFLADGGRVLLPREFDADNDGIFDEIILDCTVPPPPAPPPAAEAAPVRGRHPLLRGHRVPIGDVDQVRYQGSST